MYNSIFRRRAESHEQNEFFNTEEGVRQYTEMAHKTPVRYNAFLDELDALGIRGRYLEVGAGPGQLAAIIARKYPDVQITAIEISSEMAAVGEAYVSNQGLDGRIDYVVGDADDVDLIAGLGQFDLVYCTFTLHHFPNPEHIIGNLMNAVADHGALFLYDLRRVWWLYWLPSQNGFIRSVRAAYRTPEIAAMFGKAGIELTKNAPVFPCLQTVIARK